MLRRARRFGLVPVSIVVAVAIGGAPAVATTCSTVSACVFGSNARTTVASGFGANAGVAATSLAGDGVDGATHFASTGSAAKSGVAGFDMSTTGTRNSGVFGYSGRGSGVYGVTNGGTGVVGVATAAQGAAMRALGKSLALHAEFLNGTGVSIRDASNISYTSNVGISVGVLGDGIDVGTDFGNGLNVTAGPMSNGAVITSYGGDGLDIDEQGPGVPLYINPSGANDSIFVAGALALDPSGNLTISGALTQNGTPLSVTKTSNGHSLKTYAPRETEATIEDFGEAAVVRGRASVVLDPAFAATLDGRRPYYVFLTAEGDNRGLFVGSKNARGFTIRETSGGTSTLAVQYRIVGKPYDAAGTARLAAMDTAMPYARSPRHVADVKRRAARSKNLLMRLRSAQPLEPTR